MGLIIKLFHVHLGDAYPQGKMPECGSLEKDLGQQPGFSAVNAGKNRLGDILIRWIFETSSRQFLHCDCCFDRKGKK